MAEDGKGEYSAIKGLQSERCVAGETFPRPQEKIKPLTSRTKAVWRKAETRIPPGALDPYGSDFQDQDNDEEDEPHDGAPTQSLDSHSMGRLETRNK